MSKLNQIIAIEKGVKSRVFSEISELHKINQKPELFNGLSRQYQKKDEEGEDFPPERKKVQFSADEILARFSRISSELLDVTARKDWSNGSAVADIRVEDKTILAKVPVTYLLFLEKQLTDMRTFINAIPVLDEAENWVKDTSSGLYKTNVVQTHRTKKVVKPIVLYPATDAHPAQTQLITEDVLAGYWLQERHSGAIQAPKKKAIAERVEKLIQAVKAAREEANGINEITTPDVGEAVFNYVLGE